MSARQADVFATSEGMIGASVEVVWDLLADIESWPQWNPDIKTATLEGPLANGTVFRWKAGPGTITSRLRSVERPIRISWEGRTLGIDAEHTWELDNSGSGTIARTEESWRGLLPRLLRGPARRMLQRSLDASLEYLRVEAERRSR